MSLRKLGRFAALATLIAALVVPASAASAASLPKLATTKTVRIGYFANITHAPALIAKQKQLFEKYLGASVKIEYTVFTAGPSAIEAMKGRALDITYIGPNPSIAGFTTTDGQLLNVVSGATSGGAKFIVKAALAPATEGKPTAAEIAALKGKTFASPQLGGTQDVALRNYLRKNSIGFNGGDSGAVISPSENATTLSLFKSGQIDGAWVPEPWASRLILEGGGKVFVDEASLWKGGKFVTTQIVASKSFLKSYPGTVRAVLRANNEAIKFLSNPANKQASIDLVQAELYAQTGKKLTDDVINAAWPSLTFTQDPLGTTLAANFVAAVKVGQLVGYIPDDLRGIYDLRLLNSLRTFAKQKQISLPDSVKPKK